MKSKTSLRSFLFVAGSSLLSVASASAADGTWDTDLAGNWTDITKWLGDADYAFGTDSTATFGNVITADRIITLDSLVTIGNITASDTSNNYTISGANTITLDRTTGVPIINVTQSGRTLTINSQISGSDGLLKSGAGDLILGGSNNFTGGLYISAGRIVYQSTTGANVWGDAANVITFTGNATLHNNDGAYTLARGINVNGFTATLTGAFGESTNVTGAVTGTGTLNVTGASNGWAVTLSNAANTFTGAVGVFGGAGTASLSVASLGSSANAITLGTGNNGPGTFTYTGSTTLNRALALGGTTAGGTFNSSGTGVITINTNLSITANGAKTLTLGGSNTGPNTFSGSIGNSGAGATAITKADAGRWILTNASNSYTGGTNISGGTLGFASDALGSSGAINASGGTLLWLPGNTQDISNRLAFTAGGTSTFNTNGNDVTFASAIGSSNTGNFVKTGLGTLTLQGTNTFTSGTTALTGGGTLVLDYGTNNNRKLPSGAFSSSGGKIVLKGGSATESSTSFTTSIAAGTFFVRDTGTSKINLNGFTLTSNQAVVSFSDASMATTDRLNDATGILGAQFTVGDSWATSAASGTDINIVKYTGATTFNPASATTNTTNYDLTGNVTLSASRGVNTLRIVGDGNNQVLSLGGNGTTFNLTTSNFTTAAGNTTVGGLLYAGGGNDNYTISTSGTGAGRLLIQNGNGQTQHVNVFKGTLNLDVIVGNGSSSFQKTGEGTLVFNKANGYSGATRVYQGVLRVTGAGTLTAGTTVQNGAAIELGNSVAVGSGATLNITGAGVSDGGALRNVATTSSSYAAAITIGTGGARINSDSGTLTLSGGVVTSLFNNVTFGGVGNTTVQTAAISGAGGLVKDSTGRLNLNFVNTYSGATNINQGILAVNGTGSINNSAVTVNGGNFRYNSSTAYTGALTFTSGTISGTNWNGSLGNQTVATGDILSPGNSPGTATTTGQTWAAGGTYEWEINSTAGSAGLDPGWDLITGTGTLDITATAGNEFTIDVLSLTTGNAAGAVFNFDETLSYNWMIANFNTINGFTEDAFIIDTTQFAVHNTFTGTFDIALGNTGSIGGTNNQIWLTYTAIPEPKAVLLGCLGVLLLLRRRR